MSNLLLATGLLFLGIVAVTIVLSFVIGSHRPHGTKAQTRARILSETRAAARRTRNTA